MVEEKETVVQFDKLVVDPKLKHQLVTDRLKSRHATAIIFGYLGVRRVVLKLLLTLNNNSRAFIITQDGLPGFLFHVHDFASWIDLFISSVEYRIEMNCLTYPDEMKTLLN